MPHDTYEDFVRPMMATLWSLDGRDEGEIQRRLLVLDEEQEVGFWQRARMPLRLLGWIPWVRRWLAYHEELGQARIWNRKAELDLLDVEDIHH